MESPIGARLRFLLLKRSPCRKRGEPRGRFAVPLRYAGLPFDIASRLRKTETAPTDPSAIATRCAPAPRLGSKPLLHALGSIAQSRLWVVRSVLQSRAKLNAPAGARNSASLVSTGGVRVVPVSRRFLIAPPLARLVHKEFAPARMTEDISPLTLSATLTFGWTAARRPSF